MTDRKKLVERLEKLLNLGSSTNANEAVAALDKAAKFMQEHRLSPKDIHESKIVEFEVKSTQSISKPKDWELMFLANVAKVFGFRVALFQGGNSHLVDYWGRYIVIGHRDKAEICEYTLVVLLRQLVKARTNFSKKLSDEGYRRGKPMTAQLDGFCKGWVYAANKKAGEFHNSPEMEKALDEYIESKSKGKKPARVSNRGQGAFGMAAGVRAGGDIDLYRPVNEAKLARIGAK